MGDAARLALPDSAIEVVGHGGAGDFFPGNGRRSIEKALDIGVHRIEFDVQLSGDGELVLVHDDDVMVEGRKRPVRGVPTRALRTVFPDLLTFDEVAELVGGRAPFMVDVKSPGYEEQVVVAIRRHGLAAESSASSTHARTVHRLRHEFPEMRVGLSSGQLATGMRHVLSRKLLTRILRSLVPAPLTIAAEACGASEVMVAHRLCTRGLVSGLHERGFRVNVWTVDRPSSIRRAIGLGVDGIISNRPDLVWEELGRAGVASWNPPESATER
jgi:glycerophosphoryl diester phosphodiesterase